MFPVHDRGYKRLFSHPRLFRQLLESFVNEAWVKELDFEHCEKLDKSFISQHYKATESDLLYKVKCREQEIYVYILLEFQSTVTWFMAVRFLHYICSFWLDYAESQPTTKKLPAVFPLLLYSGEAQWTAKTDLAELLEQPNLFKSYTPTFRYYTIAEHDYEPEHLLKINNLVSTLFLAETHYDLELLQTQLLNLFDKEQDKQAVSLLFNWFKQLVVHGRREPVDYEALEQVYTQKTEAKQMLETAIAQEREKFFAQGRAEGEAQGWAKGQAYGRAELLIALLEKRFSALTPEQKKYIHQLDEKSLLALTEKLWQAQSVQDILKA
ncbi:MAG: Rpn family recombination-promoting nuclease/putative transposase [Pseudomonadota bacterium]|nr:Rpn family recombination-promoting nuclease/putative transposase [Pseudomonadota bacterium]